MTERFSETLYDAYTQVFSVDEMLYRHHTAHQDLIVFHNAKFGRVMALDGIVQTTERDEFIYHEMLAHVPLVAHPKPVSVLIIGGGDGAMLREVRKHPQLERITMVEIDAAVIDMAKTYLPNHSAGAFDDPRLQLVIGDGARFVADTDEKFDVIIVDSTDPIGPGEVLFQFDFYANCKACLSDGGIIVTQNGVAFFQLDEATSTMQSFSRLFADWHLFSAAVPTYVGGVMVFGWGTDDCNLRCQPEGELAQRIDSAGLATRYYSAAIHNGSFALPKYVADAIGK